ncbi:carbohydrate kinase family protein [Planctomicrobium sp. SH527]|uniref:carbohydrate kinase family protein n=1 Tax=Planctomicrobium sp. SH527 TaxID=3448123 RepID=UPI003F5BBEB9
MSIDSCEIVVAGHICLDVIPTFEHREGAEPPSIRPGHLIKVGPSVCSTGGTVSNTGLALHRLGTPVKLIGKLGNDLFGAEVLRLLKVQGSHLADGMVSVPGEVTSYSIVINPPGVDRTFLHCPGANDTFRANDVNPADLGEAKLFHFGYPPIMKAMYENSGSELALLLKKVRDVGLTVSLDLCMVDPNSEAGQVDWKQLLANALPHVDVFCPSIDELLFMLDRKRFEEAVADGGFDAARHVDRDLLRSISSECLKLGAGIVAIKLGEQGLYLRTSADRTRLASLGRATPADLDNWIDREIISPCFEVNVVGTTGSGDCTIAGLLSAFVRGESPEAVVRCAVAVGGASVEASDAVSGVSSWSNIAQRIQQGWKMRTTAIDLN